MDPSEVLVITASGDQRFSRLALTRGPHAEGTIPVGIGLMVAGVTSYLFLKVAKIALGSDEAVQPIASLWIATFALAPGFFLPLEQELARTLAHRRALGQGGKPVVARVRTLGIGLAVLVTVATLAASPLIVSGYFDGDWVLLIALILAFAAYAPAHLSRGIASGNGRFHAYAIVMGADGAVRIVFCAALAILGVKTVGLYGFAVALSPLPGVLWVKAKAPCAPSPVRRRRGRGHPEPRLAAARLGLRRRPGQRRPAGSDVARQRQREGAGDPVHLRRAARPHPAVPVPGSAGSVAAALVAPRRSQRDRRVPCRVRRLMKLVLVVGSVGTAGAFLLGPFVIEKLLQRQAQRHTMAMLALGSAFYMVALAIAQAVIALRGHALVALGWVVAAVDVRAGHMARLRESVPAGRVRSGGLLVRRAGCSPWPCAPDCEVARCHPDSR